MLARELSAFIITLNREIIQIPYDFSIECRVIRKRIVNQLVSFSLHLVNV